MRQELFIAPCGMNCLLCMAYQRKRDHCPGCLAPDRDKQRACVSCRIKLCPERAPDKRFCFSCQKFPCPRIKHLDKRYRTKYGMSMLQNLQAIKASGVTKFLRSEKEKWACPKCGSLLCVHRPACQSCGGSNKRYPLKHPSSAD
jgi:hypothetical protein